MLRAIDRISEACGHLAAWLFFAIGLMVSYEVVVRYVFNAPTDWTGEISQFCQIWATYLAAAFVLHNRDLIAIDFFTGRLGPRARRLADSLSLVLIALFCTAAVVLGGRIVLESVAQNRHTSTMLNVPRWMTEIAVPLGFALLLVQCGVEMIRLWASEREPF